MASNWSTCGICDSLKLSKQAVVMCFDCSEGLCFDCEKRHSVSRASKDHETMPIEKYQELPAKITRFNQICPVHNERYQTYCQKHDCPCCHRCVIEKHNTCKDLKAIDDIIQNIKSSNAFLEMEDTLEEIAKNVSTVIESVLLHGATIRNEKLAIEKTILETRRKINNHLDNIQFLLTKELQFLEGKENEKLDAFILKLKDRETAVNGFQKTLARVKDHASELQVFLAMKALEKDIKTEEEKFDTLRSSNATQEMHLDLKMNEVVRLFENDIKQFGQVTVQYLPNSLIFDNLKEKQAQKLNSTSTFIDKISLSLIRSFEISQQCISSCVLLPDGRSAFSCDSAGVLVAKPNDTGDFAVSLKPYQSRDIAFIQSTNSLAAPCSKSNKHFIHIIDMKKQLITQLFNISNDYNGVYYKDDNSLLLIGSKGIQILDLADITMKSVTDRTIPGTPYVTAFGDNIFYTVNNDSRVFLKKRVSEGVKCCDLYGNTKWQFEDEKILKSPKGITVDNEGCIYVTGNHSNNVVVLCPDGSQHAILLSSRDGLVSPVGIDYDRSTNQLLVANQYGKVSLYKVEKQ